MHAPSLTRVQTRGPRPQPSNLHVALPAFRCALLSAVLSDYTNNLHPVIALLARRRATLRRSTRSTMRRILHKASTQTSHLDRADHALQGALRRKVPKNTKPLTDYNIISRQSFTLRDHMTSLPYISRLFLRCLSQRGGVMKPKTSYSTNYRQFRWRPPA